MNDKLEKRQAKIEGSVKHLSDLQIRAQESLKNAKARKKSLLQKIKEKTGKSSSTAFQTYVENLEKQIESLMDECEAVLEQFEDSSSLDFDEDDEDDDDFDL